MTTCVIEDCERKAKARGWCDKHWQRWYHKGDPLALKIAEPGSDDVTYVGAHDRVRRKYGSASQYTCPCGAPAHEWAYDHEDPDEKEGYLGSGRPVIYSVKVEHYIAMCRPCHRSMDMTRRPERKCELDDCNKKHYGRGYCKLHYRRWRDRGSAVERVPA